MRKSTVMIFAVTLSATGCAASQPAAPPPATAAAAPAGPAPAPAASPAAAPAATAAPAPADSAPKESSGPTINWAAMSKEQRKDYMKSVVMPQMKETFAGFNADRYRSMTCLTCHGDGVMQGKFTMPNPKLPKLPATPDGFQKLMSEKPAMMQFMATKVKPQMAHLLGMPEFTPQTKTGFGCFQCHTKEGQ